MGIDRPFAFCGGHPAGIKPGPRKLFPGTDPEIRFLRAVPVTDLESVLHPAPQFIRMPHHHFCFFHTSFLQISADQRGRYGISCIIQHRRNNQYIIPVFSSVLPKQFGVTSASLSECVIPSGHNRPKIYRCSQHLQKSFRFHFCSQVRKFQKLQFVRAEPGTRLTLRVRHPKAEDAAITITLES